VLEIRNDELASFEDADKNFHLLLTLVVTLSKNLFAVFVLYYTIQILKYY